MPGALLPLRRQNKWMRGEIKSPEFESISIVISFHMFTYSNYFSI